MNGMNEEQLGELLSAYLDGELDEATTRQIEQRLHEDEGARRLLDELRRAVDAMSTLPRHAAPPSIEEDIAAHLERHELIGDHDAPPSRPAGRRTSVVGILSMAAMFALVVVGGTWIVRDYASRDNRPEQLALAPNQPQKTKEPMRNNVEASREDRSAQTLDKDLSDRPTEELPHQTARARLAETEKKAQPRQPTLPAIPVGQKTPEATILALADVEQKLAAGVPLEAIQAHTFANESNQLTVKLRDPDELQAVAARLTAHLSGQLLTNLADATPTTSEDESETKDRQTMAFFYEGRQGVNFDAPGTEQILVRLPQSQLDDLLSEVGSAVQRRGVVALQAGPVVVRGLGNAQRLIHSQAEMAGRHATGADENERLAQADESTEPGGGLFGGLFDIMGLNEAVLSAAQPASPDDTAASPGETDATSDAVANRSVSVKEAGTDDADQTRLAFAHRQSGEAVPPSPGTARRYSVMKKRGKAPNKEEYAAGKGHAATRARPRPDHPARPDTLRVDDGETRVDVSNQPGLVERRTHALSKTRDQAAATAGSEMREEAPAKRAAEPVHATGVVAAAEPPRREPFVTLVVELTTDQAPGRPAGSAKQAPAGKNESKSGPKDPTKPPSK